MLVRFFTDLRAGGVPVTIPEFLSLLEALESRVVASSPEEFYYLARLAMVKDERHFDRFDRVFAEHFKCAEKVFEKIVAELPADWLKAITERLLTEEEKKKVESLGGWDKLLETLRERLKEQQGRHEGGGKWLVEIKRRIFSPMRLRRLGLTIAGCGSRWHHQAVDGAVRAKA